MSVNEIIDRGNIIPWANLRANNMTIDGTYNLSITAPSTGGASGLVTYIDGSVRITTTALTNLYTYPLPPAGPNNATYLIKYLTVNKGGISGSTGNAYSGETTSLLLAQNGVYTTRLFYSNSFPSPPIGYGVGTVAQSITISGTNLLFGFQNTNVSNTTDIIYFIQIYALNTTL